MKEVVEDKDDLNMSSDALGKIMSHPQPVCLHKNFIVLDFFLVISSFYVFFLHFILFNVVFSDFEVLPRLLSLLSDGVLHNKLLNINEYK